MALQSRNNDKPIETSEMVSAFDKFVNDVVGFVENLFKKPEVSLDEFASKSSKEIDKIILKKMKEGNEFIAGRFKLMFLNDLNFCFSFDIYLKNPNDKDYMRINGSSKVISMERLQVDARAELKQKKEIAYEIEEPQSGKYSQIDDENSEVKEIRETSEASLQKI